MVLVLLVYWASNLVQHEAGLLSVTVMGVVLGNMRLVERDSLRHFKENLTVILLSALFIVIPAQLSLSQVEFLDWRSALFVVVVWPLERFSQLLGMALEGDLALAWGSTFLVTLVIFFPRALWEGKPDGFGAELTPLFRPDLVGLGHSEAALFYGEWVYNFGITAVLLMIPAIAWTVRWLDRAYASQSVRTLRTRTDLFLKVSTILLASGVMDLVWVGTFTYAARTGMRLLIVCLLFAIFTWSSKPYMPAIRSVATRLRRQ